MGSFKMSRLCFLVSEEDNNIKVLLRSGEEVLLGRCPETNIKDKRCSKHQVSLLADYASKTVEVKHLGGNPSAANGIILKNSTCVLKQNDVLEFLIGKHKFRVDFSLLSKDKLKRASEESSSHEKIQSPEPKRTCKETECSLVSLTSNEKSIWERVDDGKLLIFTSVGVQSKAKIAAYDLDGTIILTKSGRVFPKDKDDWKITNASVKPKLTKLFEDGYKIVILTNQAGIGRGKTNINEFKEKIEIILKILSVPVQVFISTSNSIYRKPAPGMWTFLKTKKNDGIKIDMVNSFYVGDAAGRIVNWAPGKKKDFSSADRLLALNLNLAFYTPEEHFLKERPGKYLLPSFKPADLDDSILVTDKEIVSKSKEVILMVGAPGSGKSHFACKYLTPAGYAYVNRDTLGSWQSCVRNMESALEAGQRVVVDNTNPDVESRKRFIERAAALHVPCRCFVMTTSIDHNRHNNRFRELTDKKHIPVNEMIVNSFRNKFQVPSLDEGFAEIVNVNFVPSFSDPELKKLYQMYLLEK